MGLHQIAFFVQVRHYVADRGCAQAVAAPAGDGARSYRLAGGDVAFDDLMQNLEAPWRHSLLKMKRLQTASVHPHYRMELLSEES